MRVLAMLFPPSIRWGLLIFCVVVVGAEYALRQPTAMANLPVPTVGGGYSEMDVKLHQLEYHTQKTGAVDCIFVGNSMVRAGIDIHQFETTLGELTSQTINCYNFGVSGMSPTTTEGIIEYLIDRYEPKWIIWGVTALEFDQNSQGALFEQNFKETNWMRYRIDSVLTVDGILTDRSFLYRHIKAVSSHIVSNAWRSSQVIWRPYEQGFLPFPSYRINLHPITLRTVYNDPPPFEWQFQSNPPDVQAFEEVMNTLGDSDSTALILVEIPALLHSEGSQDYLVNVLADRAREANIPFWETSPYMNLSMVHFADATHFLQSTARAFSEWLALQFAPAMQQNNFPIRLPDVNRRLTLAETPDIPSNIETQLPALNGAVFTPLRLIYDEDFDRALLLNCLETVSGCLTPKNVTLLALLDAANRDSEVQTNWAVSFEPNILLENGYTGLLVNSIWESHLTDEALARVYQNPQYCLDQRYTVNQLEAFHVSYMYFTIIPAQTSCERFGES